jgi:hypothetical protein
MAKLHMIPLAAALLIAASASQAQQSQPRETTPQQQDSHSDGTAPHGMSSSGWTGGTGGSHIGTSNQLTTGASSDHGSASEDASDQPLMATGKDLNGPPTQFPANKTPE